MKTAAILSIASLFSSIVSAIPLDKRAIVTEVKTEVVYVTTTIWVDPPSETSNVEAVDGAFYDNPDEDEVERENEVVATTTSTSSSSYVSSSSTPPPPPPSTPTPEPTPTPSPSPSSSYVAPAAPESSPAATYEKQDPAPVENNYVQEAPVEETTASGSFENAGKLTYYDPGMGSCGIDSKGTEPVVAISHIVMDRYNTGNPNNNPMCGKSMTIEYKGKTMDVKIVDRCTGCAENDVDVSPSVFEYLVGSKDAGRVDCTWTMS